MDIAITVKLRAKFEVELMLKNFSFGFVPKPDVGRKWKRPLDPTIRMSEAATNF